MPLSQTARQKQTTFYGREREFLCLVCGLGAYVLQEEFPAEAKEAETVAGGFSLDMSPVRDDHTRNRSKFTSTEETRSSPRSIPHCAQSYDPTTTCAKSRGVLHQRPWREAPGVSFLRVCFARLGINKEKPSSRELGGNCHHPPASLLPFPGDGVGFTLLNRSNNSPFKGYLRSRSDGAASK